jgi:hypothetical protein
MDNKNTPASWYSSKVRLNGYKDLTRWNIRMNNLRKAFYQAKANADAAAKANADAAAKANADAAAKANADAAAKANADSTLTTNSPFWFGTATSPDFKDVIKNTDPKHITLTLNYAGQEIREMFDRRINSLINLNAYLFNAEYSDDLKIEVQVNPEFQDKAREHAEYYATVIGQLPKALRLRVKKVWIHNGEEPFGGNYYAKSLLIHVKQGDKYIADGILEEIIIHEACHTLFDGLYANDSDSDWNSNWKKSRNKDNSRYISTYAEEFPEREDIAESFLAYFAFRYRKDRISSKTYDNIKIQIPNRIKFFDSLNLNMSPYTKS